MLLNVMLVTKQIKIKWPLYGQNHTNQTDLWLVVEQEPITKWIKEVRKNLERAKIPEAQTLDSDTFQRSYNVWKGFKSSEL